MDAKKKKLLFLLLAGVMLLAVAYLPAETQTLSRTGWQFLGIFLALLTLLLSRAVPEWISGLGALCLLVVFGIGSVSQVFAPFGQGTVWLIIGIYALSVGLSNSGLIKRVALIILSKFPGTYKGQVLALMASGTIITPLIPSNYAKASILLPVSTQITEYAGFEERSKPALGLWTAALMPAFCLGIAFMTGSGYVPFMISFMDGMSFTWGSWLKYTWVWFVVGVLLTYFFCTVICKPKDGKAVISQEYIRKEIEKLGPMSAKEKKAAVIMVAALILWLTQSWHGIDAGIVTLLAITAMAACDLISTQEFAAKLPWSMIVFIGALLSVSTFMSSTGVSSWIASLIGPYLTPIVSNVWLFVPLLVLLIVLMRFAIISQTVCLALTVAIFGPLLAEAGISIFILVWVVFAGSCFWNVPYQNPYILGLLGIGGQKYVTFSEAQKASFLYVAICLIGMLASIPLWMACGLC